MSAATATAYERRAARHPSFGAPRRRKAQEQRVFWGDGARRACITDNVLLDPCCGSGGMFVQSADFVKRHAGDINDIAVYGQESNPATWKMATMNLAIRGILADLGKFNADTFFDDCHKDYGEGHYSKIC